MKSLRKTDLNKLKKIINVETGFIKFRLIDSHAIVKVLEVIVPRIDDEIIE